MIQHRAVVVGGASFIGSAVVRYLIAGTDADVLDVDKVTYVGNLESLTSVSESPNYQFAQSDICDRTKMTRLFEVFKPTSSMHLGAECHIDRSIDRPSAFIETNIVSPYTRLEVSRRYWEQLDQALQRVFRFHHISTDEVYGDLDGMNDLFTEGTPY